jgi:hypothetical protein
MKDTMGRAIGLIVRKSDTADAPVGDTPTAGEGAFPEPHPTLSTFG